jgi:hypothetical protein
MQSCYIVIGLEEYHDGGGKIAQWRKSEEIECPNTACRKEHEYSGDDFRLSEGETQL